jgi:antibiotic biosynthesis monooxygenase (ABM) superfamily enzyme
MKECRADKNWAHFYKIEGFQNWSDQKMSTVKFVLLIQGLLYPISLQENQFLRIGGSEKF